MSGEPLTRELRDALIARYHALRADHVAGVVDGSLGDDERVALREEMERVLGTYWAGLPRVPLSRCPFCEESLYHSFDPWGVEGFWWQEDLAGDEPEPPRCPHFGVLQGALNLNGRPPTGGQEEALVGPAVPFVIPRVLEQPPVVAVVSAISMANGYTAYPIAYFAEPPLGPDSFTQPWTRNSFSWEAPDGSFPWRADTDPWDFDLAPWVERRKLLWIEPGDERLRVRSAGSDRCPYVGLEGTRERQHLQHDELWTTGAPAGEELDPFSG